MLENVALEFTSCAESRDVGNLFDWTGYNLSTPTFYDELELKEFCNSKSSGIQLLPLKTTFFNAKEVCEKLNGEIVTYEEPVIDALSYDLNITKEPDGGFWMGYTDEIESNVFMSHDGRINLNSVTALKWAWGQPNGKDFENCTIAKDPYTNEILDTSCNEQNYVSCNIFSNPKFQFRGSESFGLDSIEFFKLAIGNSLEMESLSLKSSAGAILESSTDMIWKLKKDSVLLIEQEVRSHFPIGTHLWKTLDNRSLELNLNACDDRQFACKDGTCISKWNRCDQVCHCPDKSDELDCNYVKFPTNYNLLLPPLNASGKMPISVHVDIDQILDINILSETFTVKFLLTAFWKDTRLNYKNLQMKRPNIIPRATWGRMWIPNFKFRNTNDIVTTRNIVGEDDSHISLDLEREHAKSDQKSFLVRNFMYEGTEVTITKSNEYTLEFYCSLNWANYPFDSQICPLNISLVTDDPSQADFNVLALLRSNAIGTYHINLGNATNDKGANVFFVELLFSRDINPIILTTYLPTFILTLINQLTNYFIGSEMFETVVTINATTLLTLTSLFISTFESLPQTINIKLIDIWMLATFVYPFIVIIIHTIIHVNNAKNKSASGKKVNMLLKTISQIVLPAMFGVFTIWYALNGAYLIKHFGK